MFFISPKKLQWPVKCDFGLFSLRGRLTRSLPSNFPKIIDFHWKFSKLWKAITPSILVVGESFRPFWNPQTKIFQKSDGLFRAISIRKMSRAENVRKVRKPRFWTRYLVLALNVLRAQKFLKLLKFGEFEGVKNIFRPALRVQTFLKHLKFWKIWSRQKKFSTSFKG